jgi:predicted nucleotide-binding protein
MKLRINRSEAHELACVDTMQLLPDPRVVFVVHGRNLVLRDAVYAFLRALDLKPLDFAAATAATGKSAPYVGEVLDAAFARAQAVLVLFTADEEARLLPHLAQPEDPPHDRELTTQARPNVIFEAGMALALQPERTVLVEVGALRPFSDLAGRHVIRLTNNSVRRQELAQRLQTAGCAVDLSTTAWHAAGNFEVEEKKTDKATTVEQHAVPPEELSDIEIKILQFLSQDRKDDFKSEQLAQAMMISDELAWYHLERLRDAHFVNQSMNMYTGHRWSPSKKGRAFLFERGMLK